MPAYKYTTKDGKTLWYTSFHYVDWTGANKRKFKRGFKTKREALEWERLFLNKGAKDPDILFRSLVENYLQDQEARLKPTTFQNNKYLIDSKILPYFSNLKLKDIDAVSVRTWQNELINYRDENNKPYKPTYLKTINVQLSAIMNYAVRYYSLPQNPCHSAGSIGKSNAEEMKIWTRDQFEHFLPFEKKARYHAAFNILFYSGIREGELLALTPEDVPRNEAVLNINKNFASVEQTNYYLTPKTPRSKRRVTIHESLHKEILDLIDGMALDPDDRIFYFGKSGLIGEFHRRSDEAGLERITIHDLRHSHASMLIHMGVPITEISARLGHENPEITLKIYSHLYPGTERNAPERIAALFNESKDTKSKDLEDIF